MGAASVTRQSPLTRATTRPNVAVGVCTLISPASVEFVLPAGVLDVVTDVSPACLADPDVVPAGPDELDPVDFAGWEIASPPLAGHDTTLWMCMTLRQRPLALRYIDHAGRSQLRRVALGARAPV